MCPDATRIADTICAYPGCTRTVWKDPDGSFSSFCGRSHRLAMKKLDTETVGFGGGRGASASSLSFCKNCEIRPVYVENGYDHPFCGKRCASAYDAAKRPTRVESRPRDTPPPEAPPSKICSLKGCKKRAFIDASGVASPFCSQRHRRESVKTGQSEACLLCTENPKIIVGGKLSNFCSRTCSNDAINAAPAILQLNSTDVRYKAVEKQFSEQWKHPTRPGKISKIWRIISTQDAFSNFARYQLSVERARKISSGNSRRRWHGTTRQCRIGDSDNENTLCSHTSCSVCSIIRSSFQLARSGVRHNYGRFGAGIYTTGTSSKANDYIKELGGSLHRAIFLNDVVLGKTNKLTVSDPNLMQPPDGFDSVIGEPGGDLNYDEAVVYNDDAIRPLYLVIFKPT